MEKYTLKRIDDGLVKEANKVIYIEWNDDDAFKSKHDEAAIGRSLMLDSNNFNYTWLTTPIVEILEEKDKYIKFRTENSTYELNSL
jgi:hypothetical protein